MIVFGYYRVWLSVIPLIVSVQLAWRAHEYAKEEPIKKLDTADEDHKNKTNLQETTDAEKKLSQENGTLQEIEVKTGVTGEAHALNDSFTQFIKETADLGKSLLVNFGLSGRLWMINLANSRSEQLEENATDPKKDGKLLFYFGDWKTELGYAMLNIIIIYTCWYLKPVIMACLSYSRRRLFSFLCFGFSGCIFRGNLFVRTAVNFLQKCFVRKISNDLKPQCEEMNDAACNKKDPESVSSSRTSVECQLEMMNEQDQAAYVDEKRSEHEETGDADAGEWLEGSFIQGGIETFVSYENSNIDGKNNTENYLQISQVNQTGSDETKNFRTSTPDSSEVSFSRQSNRMRRSGSFTPLKLKKFLHDKYNETRQFGICLNETAIMQPLFRSVDEQKCDESLLNNNSDSAERKAMCKIDDFVFSAKNRIRNKLYSM